MFDGSMKRIEGLGGNVKESGPALQSLTMSVS